MVQFIGEQEAYSLLGEAAACITAIGVAADYAVHEHNQRAITGPLRSHLAMKLDGTLTAAYWAEGAALWAAAHPRHRVLTIRATEDGWPEFNVDGRVHLRVERVHRGDSARRRARSVQGPDVHREAMRLFDMTGEKADFEGEPLAVDLTAAFDDRGRIAGATVTAPWGRQPLWSWDVTTQEVMRRLTRWRSSASVPWLHDIDVLATMRRPDEWLTATGTGATSDLDRTGSTSVGRTFAVTQETITPAQAGVAEGDAATPTGNDLG